MIRVATLEDVPEIVAMGLRFGQTDAYRERLPVSAEHLTAMASRLLSSDQTTIFVAEQGGAVVGMLALTTYDHPMTGERVTSELAWWMDPSARGRDGIRLLRAGEQWAREQDSAQMVMVSPSDRVGRFYETVGYVKAETVYERRL